ncbi:hypothetical protein N9T87_00635 [bacterium]|nr:hypothetical protein [bacterium]
MKDLDNLSKNYLNFNEVGLSAIGYKNKWIQLQLSNGKENWGAGEKNQLALSNESKLYNYFLLASDYGALRVNYIHGLLEGYNDTINRYIVARGLEWTNKKSFIVGFSETIIYSGLNRSLDIGYLNPIGSHLEIEFNNRLNEISLHSSNAVWQVHLDYFSFQRIRLSINYLIDEFVLDPNIEKGKTNLDAYSICLTYVPLVNSKHIISVSGNITRIGTYTFRHFNENNNFVQNKSPLGNLNGSDSQEYYISFNYFNKKNLFSNLIIGTVYTGDENIKKKPLEPYMSNLAGKFPSGRVIEDRFLKYEIEWWLNNISSITISFNSSHVSRNNFLININLYRPFFY